MPHQTAKNLAKLWRILHNLKEFYIILKNLLESCRILQKLAEYYRNLQNLIKSSRILLNPAESWFADQGWSVYLSWFLSVYLGMMYFFPTNIKNCLQSTRVQVSGVKLRKKIVSNTFLTHGKIPGRDLPKSEYLLTDRHCVLSQTNKKSWICHVCLSIKLCPLYYF